MGRGGDLRAQQSCRLATCRTRKRLFSTKLEKCADFLVKDLHLDWRRGARWFMEHLVDGDLASNQLNWQWVAGSGTDAAPYFRVFNRVAQGRKFDPDGTYIKRWVPELRPLTAASVHEPWRYTDPTLYPRPVVDHATERREALERYGHLRDQSHP